MRSRFEMVKTEMGVTVTELGEPLNWDRIHKLLLAGVEYEHDNKRLRKLLAVAYGGVDLCTDDGELQLNDTPPFIDFVRDTVPEIEDKIVARSVRVLKTEIVDDEY